MRVGFRLKLLSAAAAIAGLLLAAGAGSAAAAGPPLPPWLDNGRGPWIAHVCALPIPRVAGCSADVVTSSAGLPLASSAPPAGALGPSQFRSAYNLPTSAPNTEMIGIVDAYDDPNIAADLATFDSQYGLPAPPSFRKVNQNGGTSYPRSNSGWALEISLDVEIAHAICQNCNILLVEASSNSLANLGAAENEAVKLGATVISNSWGASEYSSETSDESSYFKHPGVAITASAGDSGYGVEFPAASQYVTAVGGTTLNLSNGSYGSESVWNGTGSGCSRYEAKPSWQHDTGCSRRTVNDVSADADPNTGAAVYDSVSYSGQKGWFQVGGTSLSAPLIAAVYALAGTPSSLTYGSAPYAAAAGLHDVTSGSNGSCGGSYLCTAQSGYDAPTGLGTPNGVVAFAAASSTTPGAPTGLEATAGNRSVSLSWTAPTNTGGSSITGYNVYRGTSPGGETLVKSGATATSYNDTGLTNGTTYSYEVTAVNASNSESPKSGEVSATPATVPGVPTLNQPTAGNGSVSLSWSAPSSDGGATITSYNIYRSTTKGGEGSTPFHTGVTGTGYSDNSVTNGTTYYYEVTAVNGIGEGPASSEASATPEASKPGAPTGLAATAGDGYVALSWSAPSSDGGATITSYNIYRSTTKGGEGSTPFHTGVTGTGYTDNSVTNGTTYYYEVTAVNGIGEGPASNEGSATPAAVTAPSAPTGLKATAGNGSAALSWSAPSSDGGSSIQYYNVYRSTTSGDELKNAAIATNVTSTSYSDNSVPNGTTYYYEVTAVNGIGEGPPSNEASATPQAPVGDFSIGISPSSRFIGSSGSTTYTVTITPSNGFSGTVSLSVSGLPAHVTGTFSPNPATSSSTLTITASGAGFARVTFTVTGTSGSVTHTATASVFVF